MWGGVVRWLLTLGDSLADDDERVEALADRAHGVVDLVRGRPVDIGAAPIGVADVDVRRRIAALARRLSDECVGIGALDAFAERGELQQRERAAKSARIEAEDVGAVRLRSP